jgi:2-dehydro-3-deoxyphosphogluconate aldolase/(4S)-4-hydroxy-2-oxoglutarate aldolase
MSEPMNTLELASHGPVIPVIVLQHVEDAIPLAQALVEGGVRVLEVTMRTPVAPSAGASSRRARAATWNSRSPPCSSR